MHRLFLAITVGVGLAISASYAHQPVMDMAPRWEDGYGLQIRHEYYGSDELLDGDSEIANPLGLERFVNKTWLEGVYTFDRSKRVTFKLPYVHQRRIKNIGGIGIKQRNSGLGDMIIGLPFKFYTNLGANTSNYGVTPSIRIPTGETSGDFPISDGSWDVGLSVSYNSEGFPFGTEKHLKIYQLYDLFYWYNSEGKNDMREGNELGLDVNIGLHPYHDDQINAGMFVMWDVTARYSGSPSSANLTTANGGKRIQTGPVLVLYKDNIMFRGEYKYPLYENTNSISNSRGHEFSIGIGVTF